MKLLFISLLFLISLMSASVLSNINKNVPVKNQEFIKFIEHNGKNLAPTYKDANCVRFMDELLTKFVGIDDMTSERIYINHDIPTIEKWLKRGDSTLVTGVCWALIACNKAEWINPKDTKRGDIIQYWSTDGFTNGHCGILYEEDHNGYILLSSHPDSKGFGTMSVNNKLFPNMKIFIVRLK